MMNLRERFTAAAHAVDLCYEEQPALLWFDRYVETILGGDAWQAHAETSTQSFYSLNENRGADLAAAFEITRAAASRALIVGSQGAVVIWGDAATTASRLTQAANLSEPVRAFLQDPANRQLLRGRFPKAGFTDEYIDALLNSPAPVSPPPYQRIPSADDQ